eukprot:13482804-Alexandrium_andersonii.AAC.1
MCNIDESCPRPDQAVERRAPSRHTSAVQAKPTAELPTFRLAATMDAAGRALLDAVNAATRALQTA